MLTVVVRQLVSVDGKDVSAKRIDLVFVASIVTQACTDVQIDERFEPVFPSVRVLSASYTVVGNKATAYERPIFYNNNTNDVILFTGTSGRTVFFGTICA